jgi:hypothetical protein
MRPFLDDKKYLLALPQSTIKKHPRRSVLFIKKVFKNDGYPLVPKLMRSVGTRGQKKMAKPGF